MLNGKVSLHNPLTLHHIVPVRKKGRTTVENGALLSQKLHNDFNLVEMYSQSDGDYVNEGLQYYKQTREELVREQLGDFVLEKVKRIRGVNWSSSTYQ